MDVAHHVATDTVQLQNFFDDNLVTVAVALLFQCTLHENAVVNRNRITQAFPNVLLEEQFDFAMEVLHGSGANRIATFRLDGTHADDHATDDNRLKVIRANFRDMKAFLRLEGVRSVDGIIADLGISSHQIDSPSRGFSTRSDGKLDMRMDVRQEMSAADVVNGYDLEDLSRILKLYGELPNATQMARAICAARSEKAIATTSDLCDAVRRHLPKGYENKYLAMLFQAIRIEVNGELEALKAMLLQSSDILKDAGRLAVISYHSLEDRLVKNFIKSGNFEGEVKKDFYGNPLTPFVAVNRKVITPSETELQQNNRSRSAKLRVGERVKDQKD